MHDQELSQMEKELKHPLSSYLVKSPTTDDTLNLIRALQSEFDEITATEGIFSGEIEWEKPSLIQQMKIQIQSYRWYFWLVSLAVFTLIGIVAIPNESQPMIIEQVIPIYILIGVVYQYKTWNQEMRMVESITPFPPALLLYSRLMIILLMNVGFGLVTSIYLEVTYAYVRFFPLILSWLAPSIVVTGILIYAVFWKGIKKGMAAALITWFSFYLSFDSLAQLRSTAETIYITLQLGILLIGGVFIYLSYRKGRIIRAIL